MTTPDLQAARERLTTLAIGADFQNVNMGLHDSYGSIDGPWLSSDLRAVLAALDASEAELVRIQSEDFRKQWIAEYDALRRENETLRCDLLDAKDDVDRLSADLSVQWSMPDHVRRLVAERDDLQAKLAAVTGPRPPSESQKTAEKAARKARLDVGLEQARQALAAQTERRA